MHLIPSNIAVIKVLIFLAHKDIPPVFQLPSLFQASSKTPPRPFQEHSFPDFKMPPQEIPSELDNMSRLIEQMFLDDPYLRAMHEGRLKWGDLMLIYEKEHPTPKKQPPIPEPDRAITPPRARTATEQEAPWAPIKAPREHVEDCGICTLRLGNLPRDISAHELKTIFSAHGTVRDIHIPKNMDRSSPYFGTIRGFAMIEFDKSWEATIALTAVYGLTIRTKKITCEFAKSDRKRPDQMAAATGPATGPATATAPAAAPAPLRPYIERQVAAPRSAPRPIHKQETLPYNHFLQEDGSILHF